MIQSYWLTIVNLIVYENEKEIESCDKEGLSDLENLDIKIA